MTRKRTWVVALLACVLLVGTRPAEAQEQLDGGDRPWAQGVSKAQQDRAWELFREGNSLLKEAVFVRAAERYRSALREWDHPAIHYNLALALLNLDQPVQVYQHLEKAMKFGPAPLEQDKFEAARAYHTLIGKQLTRLEVSCQEEGARVTLDGQPLFTAPGSWAGLVRAGNHTVIASKEGYLTTEKSGELENGETTTLELKLYRDNDLTRYRRKMKPWIPWVTAGAGAAVVAGGVFLHVSARDDYQAYDDLAAACSGGCPESPEMADRKSAADTKQMLAFVGYGVGTAALAAGLTLAYLNQPEAYRINPAAPIGADETVSITPLVGPDGGGFLATVRF